MSILFGQITVKSPNNLRSKFSAKIWLVFPNPRGSSGIMIFVILLGQVRVKSREISLVQ